MTAWYLWSICGIHLSPTNLKLKVHELPSRSISFDKVRSTDSPNYEKNINGLDLSREKRIHMYIGVKLYIIQYSLYHSREILLRSWEIQSMNSQGSLIDTRYLQKVYESFNFPDKKTFFLFHTWLLHLNEIKNDAIMLVFRREKFSINAHMYL